MLLGVDVGTTGTKAVLLTPEGKILHTSYQSYPLISPRPSCVEQDPTCWWRAVVDTVRDCVRHMPMGQNVASMSLSVQSGTLVPVDCDMQPVGNAISWLDTRAGKECAEFIGQNGERFYYQKTGWRLSNCYNFIQIVHMKNQEPEKFKRVKYFLTVADYLNYQLTGRIVTDENSIGNSQLCSVETGTWDETILQLAGINREMLAETVQTGTQIGHLTNAAAEKLSLNTNVMVVAGAQDQYCSAISVGAFHAGDIMFSTGTSWVLLGIADRIVYDVNNYLTVGRHIIPKLYSGFAYTPAGGAAMKWYRDNMGKMTASASVESFDQITARAANVLPGANGLFFFPHFAGTLFPTWHPEAKGVLWGLDFIHNQDHIARAIMEGIAFELLWMTEAMQRAGYEFHLMRCLGGSTRSDVWMQIVCDMTGLRMVVSEHADMAPMGAAMIAGVGIGIYADYCEAYELLKSSERVFVPNMENHKRYQEIFKKYRSVFMRIWDKKI